MTNPFAPGTPDGPPLEDEVPAWAKFVAGLVFGGLLVIVLIVVAWCLAWLLANWPG